jgi:predicted ABC-type ATPase
VAVEQGEILVLAGTNGAGKSSIAGADFRAAGSVYYNPDEETRALRAANPALTEEEANSLAWKEGKRRLEQAIAMHGNYAFETTLGAKTIPALLKKAAQAGLMVRIWYCGLATPELHIKRVKARVMKGGHDIPDKKVRERYDNSRANLIALIPYLAELGVYDNSEEAGPGKNPLPIRVMHMRDGRVVEVLPPEKMPDWAKPIVMAAFDSMSGAGRGA